MQIRSTLALAAAAATFTLVSCEGEGLPISQTVDGAEFSHTIAGSAEATAGFSFERTVAVQNLQAQLAALGIDNVTVEGVALESIDLTIANAADLGVDDAAHLGFGDIETLVISFDDGDGALAIASLAPGTYAEADLTAALDVATGVNLLSYLEQDEVTVLTEVTLKEATALTEDIDLDVVMDYEVQARVESGEQ